MILTKTIFEEVLVYYVFYLTVAIFYAYIVASDKEHVQTIHHPTNQLNDQATDQPTNQLNERLTDQPTNQPTNQPTD